MQIECLLLGKTSERYLAEGIDDFQKRLKRYTSVELRVIKEKKGRLSDKARIEQEGRDLLAQVRKKSLVVVLDKSGGQVCSEDLAALCKQWENQGRRIITFIIGGPLGLSPEVLSAADLVLSFSKMTFTHEMVRMFLLEQLYRAFSINAGSKYHK